MKVGFVTCVQLGLHCLEAVDLHGGRFSVIVTLPDDSARAKSGRVDLDDFAARTATPLLKVPNINDSACVEHLRELQLDWLMIIGWSQIARAPVLNVARLGTLGMHPTLLPKGRGRASIPWAILKGLDETGVTLFKLDEGVDSGPIAAQARIPVTPDETAATLYAKVSEAHASLLAEAWSAITDGTLAFRAQDHAAATLWPGRKPEDGLLAPDLPVLDAERLVRAVTRPYPGAFYDDVAGRLRIWSARVEQQGPNSRRGFDAANSLLHLPDGVLQLTDWVAEPRSR